MLIPGLFYGLRFRDLTWKAGVAQCLGSRFTRHWPHQLHLISTLIEVALDLMIARPKTCIRSALLLGGQRLPSQSLAEPKISG